MIRRTHGLHKAFKGVYIALVLAFLYLPILVMIGLSFNVSKSRSVWEGFTLDWYVKLFQTPAIMSALKVTLEVAIIAPVVSVIIGTLGAIGYASPVNTGRRRTRKKRSWDEAVRRKRWIRYGKNSMKQQKLFKMAGIFQTKYGQAASPQLWNRRAERSMSAFASIRAVRWEYALNATRSSI